MGLIHSEEMMNVQSTCTGPSVPSSETVEEKSVVFTQRQHEANKLLNQNQEPPSLEDWT